MIESSLSLLTLSLPPGQDDVEGVRFDSGGLSFLVHNLHLHRHWNQILGIERPTLGVRVLRSAMVHQ